MPASRSIRAAVRVGDRNGLRGQAATVAFYKERVRRILADPILPKLGLNVITKSEIDDYRHRCSRQVSRFKRPNSSIREPGVGDITALAPSCSAMGRHCSGPEDPDVAGRAQPC